MLGARQRHPDHRAVGQDGDVGAFLHHPGLADRLDVFAGRDLGQFLRLPRADRLFVPAVEGAVVEALGLEEDDRIVVLDRRDQQALGVIGVGRAHHLQARDVGE
uniref:CBS domain-containing protein n=1 Tax=Parastrongyloides trichosuri TaxID=131310 RepID=A0A0N4ZIP1_PARTI